MTFDAGAFGVRVDGGGGAREVSGEGGVSVGSSQGGYGVGWLFTRGVDLRAEGLGGVLRAKWRGGRPTLSAF